MTTVNPQNNIPISFYRDHRYFRHIIDVLQEHPHSDELLSIHAAVLIQGKTIISVGWNKPKSNGLVRTYAPHDRMTIHAEVDCVLRGRRKHDLTGSTIYVARKYKEHDYLTMSAPCSTCYTILRRYGVRHVYYTNGNGSIEYIDTKKDYQKNKNWALEAGVL